MPEQDTGGGLSHLDEQGRARMVDVGDKGVTRREARAQATVAMSPGTLGLLVSGGLPKGEVFPTARIAGISAAKKTSELIPLCHPLRLDSVDIDFDADEAASEVKVEVSVRATDRTGVEMEAMTAAAVAALTIYDMCKAVQKDVEIRAVRLLEKSGGRSGEFKRE